METENNNQGSLREEWIQGLVEIVLEELEVDTNMYPYALQIDHLLTSFSSFCLSCNLSQA